MKTKESIQDRILYQEMLITSIEKQLADVSAAIVQDVEAFKQNPASLVQWLQPRMQASETITSNLRVAQAELNVLKWALAE